MKVKIYYFIGNYDDTIIIEGCDINDIREKCDAELDKRGANYAGTEIIEE